MERGIAKRAKRGNRDLAFETDWPRQRRKMLPDVRKLINSQVETAGYLSFLKRGEDFQWLIVHRWIVYDNIIVYEK